MLTFRTLIYRAALVHFSLNPLITLSAVSARSSPAAAATAAASHYFHTSTQNLRGTGTSFLLNSQCPQAYKFSLAISTGTKKMSTSSTSSTSTTTRQANTPETTQEDHPPTAPTAQQEHEREHRGGEPLLALPPTDDSSNHILDMSANSTQGSGSSVKLDHLGPMVVNQDGTLSRISNWDQMTEIEKRNTLRVLGKRNKERMAVLREREEQAGEEQK